jgi:hypothetical protein
MKSLSRMMLWMAALGLLFPRLSPVMADETRPATGERHAAQLSVVDVKLADNGTLRGQLVNREGAAKAKRTVTAIAAGQVVAQGVTDHKGNFAIPLAKGGVYTITDGETGAVVRVWTNAAAPPSAQGGILLVSDPTLARGNHDGEGACGWFHQGGWVPVLGLVAIAGVATAIVIAATDDDAS